MRDSKERKAGRKDGMTYFEMSECPMSKVSEKGAMRQSGGNGGLKRRKSEFLICASEE